jgi:GNAT superfamily N-acetyltransferase
MPETIMTNTLNIRSATPDDVPLIRTLIRELAEYEKLAHEALATEALLREHLFGPRPKAECLIAEIGDAPAGRRTHFADGKNTVSPVGFALFFHNFSTFVGKPGIYLEDLFVRPAARGRGIGKALLVRLAQIAVERDCGRFEWSVLDWNEPALRFYESLGAVPKKEWIIHRVSGEALARLAAGGG